MYYFIYAKEGLYEGLHGVYDYGLYDCDSYEDACDIRAELSHEVIDTYIRPEDSYYSPEDYCEDNGHSEWRDEYEDDYFEALDEVIKDNYLSYEVYPLKDNVTKKDYDEWIKENMPPSDFIQHYCRQLTEEDYG